VEKTTNGKRKYGFNYPNGSIKIYDAITAENTTINSSIANSPIGYTVEKTSKVDLSYDGIKMNFDRQLYLAPDEEKADEKPLDIIDENGLSLTGDDVTGDIARGTRAISMMLDKELLRKNFAEAKQAYLYFDRVTAPTPNLDIVIQTRKGSLTKMYRSAPDLREFVEEQMTKYTYTEAYKIAVRGKQ
jgi:hypothetical protein